MQTQKLTLQTDAQGHLVGLPTFPPNISLELIVLFQEINETQIKRRPAPRLAGQVKILGDILTPMNDCPSYNKLIPYSNQPTKSKQTP